MPGNPEASVSLLVKDAPTTVVSTGPLATELARRSTNTATGPACTPPAPESSPRSPTPALTAAGPTTCPGRPSTANLSSLSVPLAIDEDEQVAGALNVYARRPHAFDQDSRTAATKFAPYAAVAAGNLHAYQSARNMAANLTRRRTASFSAERSVAWMRRTDDGDRRLRREPCRRTEASARSTSSTVRSVSR
jgi:hypothetical protein